MQSSGNLDSAEQLSNAHSAWSSSSSLHELVMPNGSSIKEGSNAQNATSRKPVFLRCVSSSRFSEASLDSDMYGDSSDLLSTTSSSIEFTNKNNDTATDEKSMNSKSEDYLNLNQLVIQFVSCGFPILVFDSSLIITYLNQEAETLFNLFSFSALGEHVGELFTSTSLLELQKVISEYLGTTTDSALRMSVSATSSVSSFIPPLQIIPPEERRKRKEKLSQQSLILQAKASTLKKVFPVKVKLVVLNKMKKLHFAAYLLPQKESDQESKEESFGVQIGESITELSVIPIISITEKGIIHTFNSAASATFGYSKQDLLGKNVKILCNPAVRAKHDYYLERYQKTREKHVVDCVRYVKGQGKNGKTLKLELRVSEIIDPVSGKSSFVGFTRDTKSMITKEEALTKITDQMYPKNIAQRLAMGQQVIDSLSKCTLLYCDIVGFTAMSKSKRPEMIVQLLHDIFSAFDDICSNLQLEKIKTIGDCYFLAGGIVEKSRHHADNCIKCGLEMIQAVQQCNEKINWDGELSVRIGIHTGRDVVAAVVGKTKRSYDLFGKSVEIAKLMEAAGATQQIHISEDTLTEIRSEKLKGLFRWHYEKDEEVNLGKIGVQTMPVRTFITELKNQ
nr:unnamed protein product [Naegleria fowleri]